MLRFAIAVLPDSDAARACGSGFSIRTTVAGARSGASGMRAAALRKWPGLLWAVLALSTAPDPAHAAAWVQKRGHGILIAGVNGYRADERFPASGGGREPLGPDGRFRSIAPHVWAEVGLTDDWTAILAFSTLWQRYSQTGYEVRSAAPGDLQAGLRRALRRPDTGWQLAVQVLGKAPTYGADVQPRPGNGQADLEMSLLAGRSFPVGSRWGFFSSEGGYRIRWGRPADQWRGEIGGGFHATSRLTVMGQAFFTRSVGTLPWLAPGVNPLIEPYFHLTRLQGSVLVRANEDWRFQFGYAQDVAGRNVGRGRQWLIAVWRSF